MPNSSKPPHLLLLAGIQGKFHIESSAFDPHQFTRQDLENEIIAAVREHPEIYPDECLQMCSKKHLPILVRAGFVERIGMSLYYAITNKGQLADFDYEVAA